MKKETKIIIAILVVLGLILIISERNNKIYSDKWLKASDVHDCINYSIEELSSISSSTDDIRCMLDQSDYIDKDKFDSLLCDIFDRIVELGRCIESIEEKALNIEDYFHNKMG